MLVIVNVLFTMLYRNVVMTGEVMSLCIMSGHNRLSTKIRHPITNNFMSDIDKFAFVRWYLTHRAPLIHSVNYPQSDLSNTLKNNHAGMNKISPTSALSFKTSFYGSLLLFSHCGVPHHL